MPFVCRLRNIKSRGKQDEFIVDIEPYGVYCEWFFGGSKCFRLAANIFKDFCFGHPLIIFFYENRRTDYVYVCVCCAVFILIRGKENDDKRAFAVAFALRLHIVKKDRCFMDMPVHKEE